MPRRFAPRARVARDWAPGARGADRGRRGRARLSELARARRGPGRGRARPGGLLPLLAARHLTPPQVAELRALAAPVGGTGRGRRRGQRGPRAGRLSAAGARGPGDRAAAGRRPRGPAARPGGLPRARRGRRLRAPGPRRAGRAGRVGRLGQAARIAGDSSLRAAGPGRCAPRPGPPGRGVRPRLPRAHGDRPRRRRRPARSGLGGAAPLGRSSGCTLHEEEEPERCPSGPSVPGSG